MFESIIGIEYYGSWHKTNVAKEIEASANGIVKGSSGSKLDCINISCTFVQFIN